VVEAGRGIEFAGQIGGVAMVFFCLSLFLKRLLQILDHFFCVVLDDKYYCIGMEGWE